MRDQKPLDLVQTLTKSLNACGLDIVHPFEVGSYNSLIKAHPTLRPIEDFNRPNTTALLVGNTKVFWAPFVSDYQSDAGRSESNNPVDCYVEREINRSLQSLRLPHYVMFGHHDGDGFISLLHAAEASGFAKVSPAYMAIHPQYGLWFGMRAVIVIDTAAELSHEAQQPSPCSDCHAPCGDTLAKLLADNNNDLTACSWQERVKVRDACPVGEGYRYSEDQIRYHYSRDKRVLNHLSNQEPQT